MGDREMIFDIPMKSNLGVVFAAYIKPVGIRVEKSRMRKLGKK